MPSPDAVATRPDGAVALVTGGSRGIGAAVARELAAAGWPVAVNFRDDAAGAARTVSAIEDAGGRAVALAADVSSADEAARLLDRAEEKLGPVLCLVNNAGVRDDALALSLTDEQWDGVLATNL